jgi:hypothetical protein
VGAVTVTANAIAAPDGTTTADKLAETASTDFHYALQTVTWTAAAHTLSVYLKAAERTWAIIGENSTASARRTWFNLSNGTVGTTAAGHTATVVALGDGWYRCSITFTASAGSQWVTVNTASGDNVGSYAGTAGSGIYIWQADLQAGSFATSPIPTTSVAVTRAADVGYISGLTVPSAWTLSESHVAQGALVNLNVAAELNDGSVNNRAFTAQNGSATLFANVTVGGAGGAGASITVPTSGNVNAAITTSGSNLLFAANGSAVSTAATSLPANTSLTRLYVGNRADTARAFGGSIRRVVIYPRAMSNAELQAITTAGAY